MKIKRFEGSNFTKIMQQVKKELGKDAVIVSTENIDGRIAVTAASDYELEAPRKMRNTEEAAAAQPSHQKPAYDPQRQRPAPAPQQGLEPLMSLSQGMEIDAMKSEIASQRTRQVQQESNFLKELAMLRESLTRLLRDTVSREGTVPVACTPYLKAGLSAGMEQSAIEQLLNTMSQGVEDAFVDDAEAVAKLKGWLAETIPAEDMLSTMRRQGGIFTFVGPTGVGKTTTLVKTATTLVLERAYSDLALVSLDFVRADGHEQLRRYASILGLPLYTYSSAEAYIQSLCDLKGKYHTVLVDTAGVSPANTASLELLERICKNDYTSSLLHLPVAAEYSHALRTVDIFGARLGTTALVYTKEDEAFRNGLIASIAAARTIPVSFVTNGQRIPEDLIPIRDADMLADIVFARTVLRG